MSQDRTVTKVSRAEVKGITPEFWANMLQPALRKELVSAAVTNARFDDALQRGDILTYNYFSGDNTVKDYITDVGWFTDMTDHEAIETTPEELKVDQTPILQKKVDDIEQLYINIDAQMELTDEATYALRNYIDSDVLSEVENAESAANGGDVIDLSNSDEVIDVFANMRKDLLKANVEDDGNWIMVVTPEEMMHIEIEAAKRGTALGDKGFANGYRGSFMGFDIYVSNNLPTKEVNGTDSNTCYVGRKNMIHTAFKATPQVTIREREKSLGYYMYFWSVYGKKTFNKYSKRFLKAYFKTADAS